MLLRYEFVVGYFNEQCFLTGSSLFRKRKYSTIIFDYESQVFQIIQIAIDRLHPDPENPRQFALACRITESQGKKDKITFYTRLSTLHRFDAIDPYLYFNPSLSVP